MIMNKIQGNTGVPMAHVHMTIFFRLAGCSFGMLADHPRCVAVAFRQVQRNNECVAESGAQARDPAPNLQFR